MLHKISKIGFTPFPGMSCCNFSINLKTEVCTFLDKVHKLKGGIEVTRDYLAFNFIYEQHQHIESLQMLPIHL